MSEDVKILEDDVNEISSESKSTPYRQHVREKERLERLYGKLTDLSYSQITQKRNGQIDFIRPNTLTCIRGSKSQFDARSGQMKALLPPLTVDCCQTFSTLSVVLLSSLGFVDPLSDCCTTSTVNYLLYISAWMHQLSYTSWPGRGLRPTLRDLNTCLYLKSFFPSTVCDGEFEVVFYNQPHKVLGFLRQMCHSGGEEKRKLGEDRARAVCGYIIVSGDYTISIFSVFHSNRWNSNCRYMKACSFYVCDSHGTQPWSLGKASISGVTFGIPPSARPRDTNSTSSFYAGSSDGMTVEEGIHYFSTILFVLLEEHRRQCAVSPTQVPYMTWTPVRRRRSLSYTAKEIKAIIDNHWIPKVFSLEGVRKEARRFDFRPLECFWGIVSRTPRDEADNNSSA